MSAYTIGVRGCQHLGYAPSGMATNPATRWNQRVVDGHHVHDATMQSMLDHGVDGIVDGGDLTHFNKPLPRDVEAANRVDDRRAAANIWAIGNSGNHCAGGGSDISAMGVMHRPALGMSAVYPDPHRGPGDGTGPHPGLYEIHTAATNPGLPDGLALHFVSHYGLSRHLPDAGVHIDPQPVDGMVNVFFSHGVFEADDRLYQCLNPHGEERPIPPQWAQRGWEAMVLSHYHTLGPVPGFGDTTHGQVWYTGSSLRRGFSDGPGPRGWLKVTVTDVGDVTIEPVEVWQRPQFDLPVIDASGLSVADVDDLVTSHLAAVALTDDESAQLTGHGGAVVRQRVTGATATQRRGLAGLRGRYLTTAAAAAWWSGLVFDGAARVDLADGERTHRAVTARVTDFTADLRRRYDLLAGQVKVPADLRDPVLDHAIRWTDRVSTPANEPETDPHPGSGDASVA